MPEALEKTGLEVSGLYYIGEEPQLQANELDSVLLQYRGIQGDRHFGLTRAMRSYEIAEFSGHRVVNDRQISLVEEADMEEIAFDMDLPIAQIEEVANKPIAQFIAEQLAANILLRGGNLNEIAVSGDVFVFGETNASENPAVRITEYNAPCRKPVVRMRKALDRLGIQPEDDFETQKEHFKEVAANKRGWVASVFKPGIIAVGNNVYVSHSKRPPITK